MPSMNHGLESYLQFDIGSESFAVELMSVKEVLTSPGLVKDEDGNQVTVIDMREKLKMKGHHSAVKSVIIFDLGDDSFGIEVDYIREVLVIDKSKIQHSKASSDNFVFGVISNTNSMTVLLDPEKIISAANKAA